MAENQDVPQNQEQPKPVPQNKDQDIKKTEAQSNISNRYQELKSSISDTQSRINVLLNTVKVDDKNLPDVKSISLSDIDKQIIQLNEKKDITSSQYLLESQSVVNTARALDKEYFSQSFDLATKIGEFDNQIIQISNKLETASSRSGLKKMFFSFEISRLNQQKKNYEQQRVILENQKTTINAKLNETKQIIQPVEKKREEVILNEIKQASQEIKSNCLSFIEQPLKNKPFLTEVRENLIKKFIKPEIDSLSKKRNSKINQKNKKEFLSVLKESFDLDELPEDKQQGIKHKLQEFFTSGGFWRMEDYYKQLIDKGADRAYASRLLKHCLVADLGNLANGFKQEGTGIQDDQIDDIIREVNSYKSHWENNQEILEPSLELIELEESIEKPGFDYLFMYMKATEESTNLPEVFTDKLKKLDDDIYSLCLDKSLTDKGGCYIDTLVYYPSPETTRNLVLIAAADSENYRTVHANGSLTQLAKRADWLQILDEAEKKYPGLKKARPVLKSWYSDGYGNEIHIQQAADDFSLQIFIEKDVDPRLKELAEEALPNEKHLDTLVSRNIIGGDEAIVLKSASQLIINIKEKRRIKSPYIHDFSITEATRNNLLSLLNEESKEENNANCKENLRRLVILSKEIISQKNNLKVLSYLTSDNVVNFIQDKSLSEGQINLLLKAYERAPIVLTNDETRQFIKEFYPQFLSEEGLDYINKLGMVCGKKYEQESVEILKLVGQSKLSKDRSLELLKGSKNILEKGRLLDQFSLLRMNPEIFLETKEGAVFFDQMITKGLCSVNKNLERVIGKQIIAKLKDFDHDFIEITHKISNHEIARLGELIKNNPQINIDDTNWQPLLISFIETNLGHGLDDFSEVSIDQIRSLFNDQKTKDFCLNKINNLWLSYLSGQNPDDISLSLMFISGFVHDYGGGPLTQIESQSNLIMSLSSALNKETTVERTQIEIFNGLKTMEGRFLREKWSNEDKADFYNASKDIIDIAPSIYSDYLNLFQQMNPPELKRFNKDILPLYRAKIILTEKTDNNNNKTHDMRDLAELRLDVRNFTSSLRSTEKPFEQQKTRLLNEITGLFKEKFGIIKVPENFTQEHIKSFTNISRYLANIHARNIDKEDTLGFYLSLMVNNKWDDFRNGIDINPGEYLVAGKAEKINNFLETRKRNNPLTTDNLEINQDQMTEFTHLLQEETQNVAIGNIDTIDVKLNNVILNLKELEDLDLYPDPFDKQRMALLLNYGNKKVGSVVARMYQQVNDPQRLFEFSQEDLLIKQEVEKIAIEKNLILNPQSLKENFQDGLKPYATVVNLLQFVEDTQAEKGVSDLRTSLQPNKEIIGIFSRLGEDFKPSSGALALSQDLDYLDNVINKKEDKLTPEEKDILKKYTGRIRNKVIELEGVFNQIKNKFAEMEKGHTETNNEQLNEKLRQVNQILNTQNTQQVITSTVTNNFNTIIENIRACLDTKTNGCNNDTDLTFGDMNKFYLYSQSESNKDGSISDQIVFIEPITRQDGKTEISFVLDRIYGTNTPLILQNQVETVIKKYLVIKQKIPNIKLSILISDAAITSGGSSSEMLIQRLKDKEIKAKWEKNIEVNIAKSATGDHYTEFGGGDRSAGKRQVGGVVIDF